MYLRSKKQLQDLELKIDNANAHHQTQINELKVEMQKLKMHNQELKKQNELIMELIEQNTT